MQEKQVFINYARADANAVNPIVSHLESKGYSVWIDRSDIDFGTEWLSEISKAINDSTVVISFISKAWMQSKICPGEFTTAYGKNKKILLVYLEETEILHGLEIVFNRIQSLFKYEYSSEYEFLDKIINSEIIKALPKTQLRTELPVTPLSAKELFDLAEKYLHGYGVAKNEKQAIILYNQAAIGGYAEAYFELGKYYSSAYGVKNTIPLPIKTLSMP